MSTTLLITTHNRTPLLERSLHALCAHTVPDEILVVDDGGGDGCEEMCDRMGDLLPIRYIYNHQPGDSICSLARNIGIRQTSSEWIVTSEPELIFVTDVIAQFSALAEQYPDHVISAGTVDHEQEGGGCQRIVGWVAPFSALYKRSWLEAVGGWDESWPSSWGWDDVDLLTRLRCSGINQHIAPEVEVRHQWHPSRACNQAENEAHFFAKDLQNSTEHIVANQGQNWGAVKCRP